MPFGPGIGGPGMGGPGWGSRGGGFFGMGRGGFFAPGPTISTRGGNAQTTKRTGYMKGDATMSSNNSGNSYVTEQQAVRAMDRYAKLAVILAAASVASNFLAAKIWQLGPFTFDGGLFLYPITFLLTDVMVEIFGKKNADVITDRICLMNIVIFLIMLFVNWLPNAQAAADVQLSALYGRSARIMVASVIGY